MNGRLSVDTVLTPGPRSGGWDSAATETMSPSCADGAAPTGGVRPNAEKIEEQIKSLLPGLSVSEKAVLLFIINRLNSGRRKYGVLNPLDGRNWRGEASEELADFMVYSAARYMEEHVLDIMSAE